MKKFVIAVSLAIFFLSICIYFFSSHIEFYLSDKKVAGYEYVTFTFDEHFSGNGFSFWNLGTRYVMRLGDNKYPPEWKNCSELVQPLRQRMENYSKSWDRHQKEIRFISESNEQGYKAYLFNGQQLFFISGYQDFDGDPPLDDEKKICDHITDATTAMTAADS